MIERQEILANIQNQIEQLSERDLTYINRVVSSLRDSKSDSMHYFGKFLGLRKKGNDMIMDLGIQNENTYGIAQGGAIYTLVDVAIGFMIIEKVGEQDQVFTLELKVNFLKKGTGNYLTAKPKVIQQGHRIVVTECGVYDETGELVAKALGTFYVSKGKRLDKEG